MASADDLVDIAFGEIGYTEDPPGSNNNKYANEVGHVPRQPWCASFVAWCCKQAKIELPSDSAYTPFMANGFMEVGRWVMPRSIKKGDIVFFDFPDSKRRIQHVGIATGPPIGGTIIDCIEGNTSQGTAGSQDNGGGVYRRRRNISTVVGAGRPNFEEFALSSEAEKQISNIHHHIAHPEVGLTKRVERIERALFDGVPSHGVPPMQRAVTEMSYNLAGLDLENRPSKIKQIIDILRSK